MTTFASEPKTERGATLAQRLDEVEASTWKACPRCATPLYGPKLARMRHVCAGCGHHLMLDAATRIAVLTDEDSFAELDADMAPADPLEFVDTKAYPERVAGSRERTGSREAARYGTATVGGRPIVLCVLDFAFMGGSMGSVVGEKVARAAELAAARRIPLVTCASSGGARMQEGIFSLFQMAKTVAALRALGDVGQPHVSILCDPVYGGVSASFASYADVIIAEPDARAGFAGPRVIEQTIRQKLPAGFQTADFLLRHGHIDAVVPRSELHATLSSIVGFHAEIGAQGTAVHPPAAACPVVAGDPWQTVKLARHEDRPLADEYAALLFDEFVELRGDRMTEDDPAILGGLARFGGRSVVVIAHRKGRGTADAVKRNFGMPHPSGYRKARRLMEYAQRCGAPLVTLVDTPGAYPGLRAEEGNQSAAIADNLAALAGLRVPTVSVIVGEGGSGGALALCVADRLLMLEHATLSVISPEGCASILFNDAGQAPRAAEALRLTAPDLMRLGIVDGVVPEPEGGAHVAPAAMAASLRAALARSLAEVTGEPVDELLDKRYRWLRAVGRVSER